MSQTVVVAEPIPIPFDLAKAILLFLSHELVAAATDQATTAANQLVEASAPHWEWFDSGGGVTVVVGDHQEEALRLTIPIDWTRRQVWPAHHRVNWRPEPGAKH